MTDCFLNIYMDYYIVLSLLCLESMKIIEGTVINVFELHFISN